MKFVKHRIPNLEIKEQLEEWIHINIYGFSIKVPESKSEDVKKFIKNAVNKQVEERGGQYGN